MHRALLLIGFAAVATASPESQGINFASVNAAPSPSLTGPPVASNSQVIPYDSASVSAVGSAAATGVASASATASQTSNSKRWLPNWGWPWGNQPQPTTASTSTSYQPTPTSKSLATTSQTASTTSTTSMQTAPTTTPPLSDACAVQPDGYGPHVQPDTVAAFESYAPFHAEAKSAAASKPAGYVSTFVDLNASVTTNTYLGLQTLHSYDVEGCSQYCDNTTLCTGFNIFVERDPSVNPAANCADPPSITNYKCTLWGSSVDTATATNYGQYRDQFQVVIAGSDGFEKTNTTTPAHCPGWQPPQYCGGDGSKGHNHPNTIIGSWFFPGPYNPLLCAAYAEAQNVINKKSPLWLKWIELITGTYNRFKVVFFNSYLVKKDGIPLGTYCVLFSQQYTPSDATYTPGWQGSNFWNIESSWSYSISG